jgi:outer membrane receptor protein involved in Fe transport
MAYARLASGYRPGGPNPALPGAVVPPKYAPDKTQNYELGLKGDILDHTLSFDASLYYINWKDVQLTLFQNSFTYYANGGRAKSQGIELSVDSKPLQGLTIGAWVAWNDAQLTQDLPATSTAYGISGERLPLSSPVSGSLSVDEEFPITHGVTGFVGASASYVGARWYNFQATPDRQGYPAYAKTDLRAGARYDTWTVNLFVNNLTDQRGVIGGGLGTINPLNFDYIQPRTIGASVVKEF